MKTALTLAAALAASTLAAPLHAAPDMRAGLWQHEFSMKSQSGQMEQAMQQMQEQLKNMPPEQRKMMEQMMAERGVELGSDSQRIKVCVSEERAKKGFVPQQDGNCTHEVIEQSGNTTRFKFRCGGPQPSSGEGEVTFSSPTSFHGKAVTTTTINGKPERMEMEQSGRWLSADCGNLKPH